MSTSLKSFAFHRQARTASAVEGEDGVEIGGISVGDHMMGIGPVGWSD